MKIPADAIAGTKHVVGVVPLNVDTDDAKDNADSLLLRFSDDEQVSRFTGCFAWHSQHQPAVLMFDLIHMSCHRTNTVSQVTECTSYCGDLIKPMSAWNLQADRWYRQLLRSHEMMQQLVGGADPASPLEVDWDSASVTSTEQAEDEKASGRQQPTHQDWRTHKHQDPDLLQYG